MIIKEQIDYLNLIIFIFIYIFFSIIIKFNLLMIVINEKLIFFFIRVKNSFDIFLKKYKNIVLNI